VEVTRTTITQTFALVITAHHISINV
jgi:hypothetical protein